MEKIHLEDIGKYSFLSNLKGSPCGMYLGFLKSNIDLKENKYINNLYLYNREKKEYKRVLSENIKYYTWIEEGKLLYFKESTDGETEIFKLQIYSQEIIESYKVPLDKISKIEKISSGKFLILGDKKRIVDEDVEIFDEIPFWANGKGIINKQRDGLYIYNKIEKSLDRISNKFEKVEKFKVIGEKVYYISKTYRDKMDVYNELKVYDLISGENKTLIGDKKFNIKDIAELNGEIIFLGTTMENYGLNENPEFYLYSNEEIRKISNMDLSIGNSVGSDCRYLSGKNLVVKDGKIYFIGTEENSSSLFSMDINGKLTKEEKIEGSLDEIEVVEKDIYGVVMEDRALEDIFLLNNKKEKITNFNGEYNKKTSQLESLIFINDHMEFEGFVLKPKEIIPGEKYPGVLMIHGGPKGVYGRNFYHEMEVLASEGYFVFYTNPRGSDGRGNEFADIRGKYGTVDYEDLMAFYKIVLEKYPEIDKSRVGVSGGSYGGFMVNWIIGHSDVFACGISQRSISNWISKFLTTDIGYYHNSQQIMGTPWENSEVLWEKSPLKYANRVKTPTLFIHSDEDYRCWMSEGIQMFTALKYHGIDSKLCLFKGANHDLSRSGKPSKRIKRMEEILHWLKKYLKK
ncbi:alpha/beta hydrolase family protein [Cetobacterium ceti]